MRRATITEAWIMPTDWSAATTCPRCGDQNLWSLPFDQRPEVNYCICPECDYLYSFRITRRWIDVAATWRSEPFSIVRAV